MYLKYKIGILLYLLILSSCKESNSSDLLGEVSPPDAPLISEIDSVISGNTADTDSTKEWGSASNMETIAERKSIKTSTKEPNEDSIDKITGGAKIEFKEASFDFGEITAGTKVDFKFYFTNTGNSPLTVHSAKATCGCTVPSYPFIPIEPGETGYIGVNYNSVGKEGNQKPVITVHSNAKNEPVKKLYLKGKVLADTGQTLDHPKKDSIGKK